jgi:hypothetical protein
LRKTPIHDLILISARDSVQLETVRAGIGTSSEKGHALDTFFSLNAAPGTFLNRHGK